MSRKNHFLGLLNRASATNVDALYTYYFRSLFNDVYNIFKLENLEPEMDYNFIMTNLILSGKVFFFKDNDTMYALNGNLSESPDTYYRPKQIITANPILGTITRTRDVDGVLVYLTPFDEIPLFGNLENGGLYQLIAYTATLLADNTSSLNIAQINSRASVIFTADDTNTAKTGEIVLKDIYNGKPYKILTSEVLGRINVNPLNTSINTHQIIDLIEAHQYIKSLFWHSIGLQSNFNMKRERLVSDEVTANIQSLAVSQDIILKTVQNGLDKVNSIFNKKYRITVNECADSISKLNESGDTNESSEINDNTSME